MTHHSDVLLRHRRRCHPTPPPADRSSRSPVPPHRAYPGIQVSSSRDDGEEAEPSYRGRKHARPNSAGEADGGPAQRRRGNNQDHEEDDGQYGESSRFRENGMGNGGVYGSISDYYGGTNEPSYTPHLLPMFQQATPFAQTNSYNQQDDPNHLEDASVLLSMAYGSQEKGQSQNTNGHSDTWTTAPNLNMMMDATNKNGSRNRHSSSSSNNSLNANGTSAQPVIAPEAATNFLPAMNWLGMKTGNTPSEGAESWVGDEFCHVSRLTGSPAATSSHLSRLLRLSTLTNSSLRQLSALLRCQTITGRSRTRLRRNRKQTKRSCEYLIRWQCTMSRKLGRIRIRNDPCFVYGMMR